MLASCVGRGRSDTDALVPGRCPMNAHLSLLYTSRGTVVRVLRRRYNKYAWPIRFCVGIPVYNVCYAPLPVWLPSAECVCARPHLAHYLMTTKDTARSRNLMEYGLWLPVAVISLHYCVQGDALIPIAQGSSLSSCCSRSVGYQSMGHAQATRVSRRGTTVAARRDGDSLLRARVWWGQLMLWLA
eukprot:6187264-Pleurochrysis_carterae.AAC.7